jgi:hypothetical protein
MACAAGSAVVRAADLNQKTIDAFERYARLTERRLDAPDQPFLWVESQPAEQRQKTMASLRGGTLVIEPLVTRDGKREIEVDDGMIHHWIGTVFARGATLASAVALLQDYNRHKDIYKPNVADSRVLTHDGDHFTVRLRFFMKKGLTVVVNSDHEAQFTRASDRASSKIKSTRIVEVENPGTSKERELPEGHDGGYLWRLNSYWRFLERDGGVYIQCESITLTRGIPTGLGWLVKPFVTSIPRETLAFTLETTRQALAPKAKDSKPNTPTP